MSQARANLSLRDFERYDRLTWIVRLRWLAIIFISLITAVSTYIFNLRLAVEYIFPVILLIAAYNVVFSLHIKKIQNGNKTELVLSNLSHRIAFLQGILDLTSLTAILHFSGGIENPFIFFYIFHIILASLLLNKDAAFFQSVYSSLLILSLSCLEYNGVLTHYDIGGFLNGSLYDNKVYVIAVNAVISSTIFISAFISTSINEKLLKKEQELSETKRALEETNLLLKEQDKRKSEYVMMVSHDLKSPLASINTLIDLLKGSYSGSLSPKSLEVVNRISKRADNMMGFINDLLNLSRIKAKERGMTDSINLAGLLTGILEDLGGMAEEKGVTVKTTFTNLVEVKGNKGEIANLFMNILSNGIKYNKKGGDLYVTLEKIGGDVIVTTADSGIGIEEEELKNIFNEFFRGTRAKEYTTDGSGLGLSLVKHVADRHGWGISVKSEVGLGTTFVVTIPEDGFKIL